MPGLVGLGDGVSIPDTNRAVLSTSFDIYDQDGQLVGYCTNVERTDNRPTVPLRHNSSSDAGRVIEQVPNPEEVKLRIVGYALYNKADLSGTIPHYSLAARLSLGTGTTGGFGGRYLFKSINSQKTPFTIRVEEVHPSTLAKSVTYYVGCMLENYSKPQNIGTITISETASVRVSWVDETASGSPASGVVVG